MHDTINPATGQIQHMVYPADSTEVDSDGVSLAGLPKGMEQVLAEHNLLNTLDRKRGRYVGVCADCNASQVARDKVAKEAKAREDEAEGSGDALLADRSI